MKAWPIIILVLGTITVALGLAVYVLITGLRLVAP